MSLATFFLRRTKIAKWTFERPFSCMGPNMYIHGPSTFACFGTKWTAKMVRSKSDWFNHFSSMFANVSSHFMFGSCLFDSALEGAVKKWICFRAFFYRFGWFKGRSQLDWSSILQETISKNVYFFTTKKVNQQLFKTYLTISGFVLDEKNPEKCFKICHIFGIRKPE